jgi:hypothetical protein
MLPDARVPEGKANYGEPTLECETTVMRMNNFYLVMKLPSAAIEISRVFEISRALEVFFRAKKIFRKKNSQLKTSITGSGYTTAGATGQNSSLAVIPWPRIWKGSGHQWMKRNDREEWHGLLMSLSRHRNFRQNIF